MIASVDKVRDLSERGVVFPDPASVFVADEVKAERIAPGSVIHPGCRVLGAETSIGPGCVLGCEGTVTLNDCRLGSNVLLAGGSFAGSVLWDRVTVGPSAHVRPGTILEEEVTCGHAVGLKQTYLMPFVTLGSLINFCDCFMAGGTSRSDHSEVGSSFVHFNYTPHQDKATASLFGDVPRGVMLDQRPIFLGGQSGAVGPVRVTYGTVIAAGSIWRRDQLAPNRLVLDHPGRKHLERVFTPGAYGGLDRLVRNNVNYIANLHAAYWWYDRVRRVTQRDMPHHLYCLGGGLVQLRAMVCERIRQFTRLVANVERLSPTGANGCERRIGDESRETLLRTWPARATSLELSSDPPRGEPPQSLVDELARAQSGGSYTAAVQGLSAVARQAGTHWLSDIVDACTSVWDDVPVRAK